MNEGNPTTRPMVMSVHGIRSTGAWQMDFADAASEVGLITATFNFGWFDLLRLAVPVERDKLVERFAEWYHEKTQLLRYGARPSVVAHSFGTYIVGKAMRKHREIKFDKVLLSGSILPRDFPWDELIGNNQVKKIRNESGQRDWPVLLVKWAVRDAGPSGRKGFGAKSPLITEDRLPDHSHGDYYSSGSIRKRWIPFLNQGGSSYDVVLGRDVESMARYSEILNQTQELDEKCYVGEKAAEPSELIGDDIAVAWIQVNPDIYLFLMDHTRRVFGYINLMPLREQAYNEVVTGQKTDHEVRAADLATYIEGGNIYLYFMSIVIDPDARRNEGFYQGAFHQMMQAAINQLVGFVREYNVRVRKIAAVGWTQEGIRLGAIYGMKERESKDPRGRPIFEIEEGEFQRSTSLRRLAEAQERSGRRGA